MKRTERVQLEMYAYLGVQQGTGQAVATFNCVHAMFCIHLLRGTQELLTQLMSVLTMSLPVFQGVCYLIWVDMIFYL